LYIQDNCEYCFPLWIMVTCDNQKFWIFKNGQWCPWLKTSTLKANTPTEALGQWTKGKIHKR
jgi:hypothetical protein